jgi:hypothetical protein
MAILETADSEGFGEDSQNIAFQARDALLRANYRAMAEQQQQTISAQASAQYAAQVNDSTQKVLEKYPDIDPSSNSEFSKFIATWREQKLGVNSEGNVVNKDAQFAWMISMMIDKLEGV